MLLRPMVVALALSAAACGNDDDSDLCPEPTQAIAAPNDARPNLSMVPECKQPEAGGMLAPGGDLVGQFHDRGLLDELIVTIAPVTLGAGKPLLPGAITTPPLELASSEVYGPFVQLRYAVRTRT